LRFWRSRLLDHLRNKHRDAGSDGPLASCTDGRNDRATTGMSKSRHANTETSAVGDHVSPEPGSTSPLSRRIGLNFRIFIIIFYNLKNMTSQEFQHHVGSQ
jgi:hypothetical protein